MKCLSCWIGLVMTLAGVPVGAADLDALVQWSRRTELSMPVSGVIASVPANAGERVSKDQVLLSLDSEPFQAAVKEAEAHLASRVSERDEAARDARQAQELYARTVLSTVELENAKMKLTRAQASAQDARAALDRARYRLRVSALRAPFDAVVLNRQAEVGQSVAAELKPPVLLVIAAAGEYSAQARVSAERAAALKVGQVLSVVVSGNTYPAELRALAYEPIEGKDPYLLEAPFKAAQPLQAGQKARIRLP